MKRLMRFVGIGLSGLCGVILLSGCDQMLLFDPKGPIGAEERFVILVSIALMLLVVIPVAVMTVWFPWKYRKSNQQATYAPKWSQSFKLEAVVWLVPAIIVTILSIIVWDTTHRLDPYKPIDTGVKPVNIEVVSLDWKWLFIYPDLNIATVNELVFPAQVPLSFRLTSATVMTSFFIPQLGSQIYAMGGMQTRLHLLADEPGTYAGQNQQFSGDGYANMRFDAIATSREEFHAWVEKVRQSPEALDPARYEALEKPSPSAPVTFFSSVKPGLFDHIIQQFSPAMGGMHHGAMEMHHGAAQEDPVPTHMNHNPSEGN